MSTAILAGSLSILSIMSAVLTLSVSRHDPSNKVRTDLVKAEEIIHHQYSPEDVILIKSYGTQAWSYWMNWADPKLKWISLPFVFPRPDAMAKYQISNDPTELLDEISLGIIRKTEMEYARIWVVIPEDSPGGIFGWEATYIAKENELIHYWFITGDGRITRLYLFNSRLK